MKWHDLFKATQSPRMMASHKSLLPIPFAGPFHIMKISTGNQQCYLVEIIRWAKTALEKATRKWEREDTAWRSIWLQIQALQCAGYVFLNKLFTWASVSLSKAWGYYHLSHRIDVNSDAEEEENSILPTITQLSVAMLEPTTHTCPVCWTSSQRGGPGGVPDLHGVLKYKLVSFPIHWCYTCN